MEHIEKDIGEFLKCEDYLMKVKNIYKLKDKLLESRIIDFKTFFCSTIGRLLEYAKVIGKIRFIYDPSIGKFAIGYANYNIHINLFGDLINSGKYGDKFNDYDDEEKDEYYGNNIEGPELTGAIIMKNQTKDILKDMPDTTRVIYEYSTFYLCNGFWFKDKISEYLQETPKKID